MSANSNAMIQALLAQRLGQGQQMPMAGGGNMGPQMMGQVSPAAAASQMAQRIMLMRALQQRPPGAPQPTPQTPAGGASTASPGVQLGWNSGNGLPAP